jgi:hypothetical protein
LFLVQEYKRENRDIFIICSFPIIFFPTVDSFTPSRFRFPLYHLLFLDSSPSDFRQESIYRKNESRLTPIQFFSIGQERQLRLGAFFPQLQLISFPFYSTFLVSICSSLARQTLRSALIVSSTTNPTDSGLGHPRKALLIKLCYRYDPIPDLGTPPHPTWRLANQEGLTRFIFEGSSLRVYERIKGNTRHIKL